METRIGLALGGGGARGFAHLGALLALEEAEIPCHYIAGTSMGAAIGAVKALGGNLRKLERLLLCLDLNDLLQVSDSALRELQRIIGRSMMDYVRGSLWKEEDAVPHDTARLHELFSLLTANRAFSDTQIPFAVVTTDVETGKRVVLTEGKLYDAITASTAVPGVFSPVARDGRYLIDGGIVDKLPTDVIIDMGATAAIAIDTGAPLTREIGTPLDAVLQSQRATSQYLTTLQLERSRAQLEGRLMVIQPDVGWIRMFDFTHVDEAIQAGKDAVRARLDEIRLTILAEASAASNPSHSGS